MRHVLIAFALLFATACDSSSTTKDAGGHPIDGGHLPDGAAHTPDGSTGTADAATSGACASVPDGGGMSGNCFTCCSNNNSAGVAKFDQFFIQECACKTGSTCNSACSGTGDVCGGGSSPSSGCAACLNGVTNSDACASPTLSDCSADTSCNAFLTCANGCP